MGRHLTLSLAQSQGVDFKLLHKSSELVGGWVDEEWDRPSGTQQRYCVGGGPQD